MTANPWISASDANVLTGVTTLDDDKVNRAARDVYDFLRFDPDPTLDFLDTSNPQHVRQKRVLGDAIAWTAAYHERNSPLKQMDQPAVEKVIGKYQVRYGSNRASGGAAQIPVLPERVRNMLQGAGLTHHVGRTDAG